MTMERLPVHRTSIPALVAEYRQACEEIRQAYALMKAAQDRLAVALGKTSVYLSGGEYDRTQWDKPGDAVDLVKREVWNELVKKMDVRSVMSSKDRDKLDDQLRTGKDMPEITEANVLAMMEGILNRIPEYVQTATKEIYDWLRPHNGWKSEYKTNEKNRWRLGEKVIIANSIRGKWTGRGFMLEYWQQSKLTDLDNVLSILDGKGPVKTYHGPTNDAIERSEDGNGETEYLSFKCYSNGNLHIKFKRMDLIEKLNKVAGGMRLKDVKEAA